jgi:hypothetical protein
MMTTTDQPQPDYVLFFQNIFADGTLSKKLTPDQLLPELKKRRDYPVIGAFLVTESEILNELSPLEVLAGRRFAAQEACPVHVVWMGRQATAIADSETDKAAHARMLEYPLQERVIRVIAAAREWFIIGG